MPGWNSSFSRSPSDRYAGSIAFSGSMLEGSCRPALPTYATLSDRLAPSSRSTEMFHWCAYDRSLASSGRYRMPWPFL